ncbi:hypothetical protein EMIHUDRAFT_204349 [Emiliania huxleyi CCMP1516]|uniref:Uncharacterized protein n=2 Tax=Emiliania huxleyi TaxID=2903 RepID=A0A0D3JY81_EMIH1|nr:hypothetical protein EMIHUDRAFT_204349 [Emiliania huxleyi CCMP1516]EOD28466.1 hypothetical protein EMIHUDRAFT_204349 [Emiliania huxleyi CCMP1516]|eukprot:XP_005780895.1 hypothetical protein EMIHUDRAFT_204349 [Emiliania huxleyi CCMP1516]
MDLAEAQAAALSEGLVLVRCLGNSTGFKGVQADGKGGFRGFYTHGSKGRRSNRQLRSVGSANEAALELSRMLRWTAACQCRVCDPPAPLPAAREEAAVVAAAAQADLTLATCGSANGYKGVDHVEGTNPKRFRVRPEMIARLGLERPPRGFRTAPEAAFWIAERLGPERSADFAAGRATWDKDEIDDALLQTADGQAFGGTMSRSLFGGFACDSCAFKPAGEGCGLLFRSAHAARLQGQRCEEAAWAGDADASWDVRHPHRGPGGRLIPDGIYRCSHRTANGTCCAFALEGIPLYGNFDHYKYYGCQEPALALTRAVEAHDRSHADMPLTVEECYEACFAATCQGYERKYELETSADNESGFAGVSVRQGGKKRYHVFEVDGMFATAHEAALARAKARTKARKQQARHEVRSSRAATLLP